LTSDCMSFEALTVQLSFTSFMVLFSAYQVLSICWYFTNIDCKSNTKANKAWLLMNKKDNLCVHNCEHENYIITVHCQEKYWFFCLDWHIST
jgi:hypothetical protein